MRKSIKIHKKVLSQVGEITTGRLGELLVASVTGGEIKNKTGFDILSPEYGKIEVKSRVLGTDGEWPRVSLGRTNIKEADYVAVLRFSPSYDIAAACMLPIEKVKALYEDYVQSKGTAHIPWEKFRKESVCIKEKVENEIDQSTKC